MGDTRVGLQRRVLLVAPPGSLGSDPAPVPLRAWFESALLDRYTNRCTPRPIASRAHRAVSKFAPSLTAGADAGRKACERARLQGRGERNRDGLAAFKPDPFCRSGRRRTVHGGFEPGRNAHALRACATRSPRAACLRGPSIPNGFHRKGFDGLGRRRRGPAAPPSQARDGPCFRSRAEARSVLPSRRGGRRRPPG